MKKKEFTIEVDGKPVRLAVVPPSNRVQLQADLEYKREFRKAVEAGLMVRAKAEQVVTEQGVWSDDRKKKYAAALAALLDGEKALATGGIPLSQARQIAIDMRVKRSELRELAQEANAIDANTAEAQAEQAKFNYLVAVCTVHADTGKPYYASVDDYLERDDDPAFGPASGAMAKLMYGLDDDYEKNRPENRFLVEHGLADPKTLRLVRRKDGKLVDDRGRLVDSDGNLVDEQGNPIAGDGTPLTADGDYKVERKPFIDDLDEPQQPSTV